MSTNSEYLVGIPTTPNTVSDSWQPAVEQIDTAKKGWNAVSLDNWDSSTTAPTVLAGSEIEAAGGLIRVSTDETILDDPGGVSSGTVYLVVDFSGTDPEWYFTNDAPVWNPSLNGFYEAASGSVDWRYTGHRCEWNGATAYSEKGVSFGGSQNATGAHKGTAGELLINSIVDGGATKTYTTATRSTSGTTTAIFPRGLIVGELYWSGAGASEECYGYVDIHDGTSWRTVSSMIWDATSATTTTSPITATGQFTIFSDGANYRYRLTVTTGTIIAGIRYVVYS